MTQNESPPFPPFMPQTPPAEPPANPKRGSRPRPSAPAKPPEPGTAKPPRQKRRASPDKAKRTTKYDLQTILKIAGTLKEADQKLFEKLLSELSAMPKAARIRILTALREVFSE